MPETESEPSPVASAPLRVRVRIGAGTPPGSGDTRVERGQDYTITAPAGSTVEQVIDTADLALPSWAWALINLRNGTICEPADLFADVLPLDGDHLLLTDAETAGAYRQSRRTVARQTLDAISGPTAGQRFLLKDRVSTLGRDESADAIIDDPSVSSLHLRISESSSGWLLEDLDSRNGTALNGAALHPARPVELADGDVIEAGRSSFRFRAGQGLPGGERAPRPDGTIGHNIRPRTAPAPFAAAVEAPEIPKRPKGPRLPLIMATIPVLAGVVLWQVTGQTMMLMFCLLAPLMAVGTYMSDKMGGRSDFKKERKAFIASLETVASEVAAQREQEHAERLRLFPDASEVTRRMIECDPDLWWRSSTHHDDLHLRVGLAKLPTEVVVTSRGGGDEELGAMLEEQAPAAPLVAGTPATIALRDRSPVGIAGPAATREGVLRWFVLQLAGLHSPREVQLVALLGEPLRRWDWLKWLPHVPTAGIGPSGAPAVGTTTSAVNAQLAALGALVDGRTSDRPGQAAATDGPRVIVIVRDTAVEDRSLLRDLLSERARHAGVHLICEADIRDDLPNGCRTLLEIESDRAVGVLSDTVDRSTVTGISIEATPLPIAEEAAAALAPVRDVTASQRGIASLPPVVSLLDLEDARPVSMPTVRGRWNTSDDRLAFALGEGQDGPIEIDLVEQGPHALVGGTSGAGKSELLRGALASMALRYPPSKLTFLLVDYKGGSALRELAKLPHAVGVVTDLDEHLANRALTSLKAEIRHRERILEDHGALDITDLLVRSPDVVLPRLLIVVDEFATLVQEVPKFVDGVLDVVQRGRSLGVHLVLATQSPRGSVSDKIRANTALSIALRTLKTDESADIIGSNEAAFIPKAARGRAWVKLDSNELVPFQSAYVGGSPDARDEVKVEVTPFALGSVDAGGAPDGPRDQLETELDAIRVAVDDAFDRSGLGLPRRPWLPELPTHIDARAGRAEHGPGWIGVIDDPSRQRTLPLVFDPVAHGNMLILGAPRSGRTSALAAVACSLAWEASTDDLHVYGLDCSGRALSTVERLPHTGAVVPADDRNRTTRLLEILTDELATRRQTFSRAEASDFEDLQRRSPSPIPRIVLLIDDYGAFVDRYEKVEIGRLTDLMKELVSDGPSFGIHSILTADRRHAVPSSVHAVIGLQLMLRMGDRNEYAHMGLPKSVESLELLPGRGFEQDGREVQLGTWASDRDQGLRDAMTLVATEIEMQTAPGLAPTPVQLLPELVTASSLPLATEAWSASVGLRERDLGATTVSLGDGHFLIAGPYKSGRSTALATIVRGLLASTPELETFALTPRVSPLERAIHWDHAQSEVTPELLATLLEAAAAHRDGRPRLIVIDDVTEIDVATVNHRLEPALRACRDANCRVLVSGETQSVHQSFNWLRELRKDGNGLLLAPDMSSHHVDLLGAKLPFRRELNFPAGRGFLVRGGGTSELVQVAAD